MRLVCVFICFVSMILPAKPLFAQMPQTPIRSPHTITRWVLPYAWYMRQWPDVLVKAGVMMSVTLSAGYLGSGAGVVLQQWCRHDYGQCIGERSLWASSGMQVGATTGAVLGTQLLSHFYAESSGDPIIISSSVVLVQATGIVAYKLLDPTWVQDDRETIVYLATMATVSSITAMIAWKATQHPAQTSASRVSMGLTPTRGGAKASLALRF